MRWSSWELQWTAFARNLSGSPPGLDLIVSEIREKLAVLLALR